MTALPRLLALALPVVLACSGADPVGGAAADGGSDGGNELLAGGPYTLRVTNAGQRAVYVQKTDASGPAVFTLAQGLTALPLYDRCDLCACGACGCAVCGAGIATVEELAPGESWDQVWSGVVWRAKPSGCPNGEQCEQEEPAPAGALTLTATYSATASADPLLGVGYLDPPTASGSTTFELPRASTLIEIRIP